MKITTLETQGAKFKHEWNIRNVDVTANDHKMNKLLQITCLASC